MPSSYTTNNGIEKPGTGEQNNTWGTTANNDFDLIDQSLDGVTSVALSGTTGTITITSGAVSNGRNRIVIFTGTLTALCTVTISPNTAAKRYWIYNNTTGGFGVTLTQGSGSTVTVANGYWACVYSDGTGTAANVSRVANSFEIGGTMKAASFSGSGAALTAIPNSALTNSSVTINGTAVALGASGTVTATASNALTIGSGLSGASYNGSAPVTVAVDATVALRADTQFIGTTAVTLNRASANLALTGITSMTMPGATSGTVQLIPAAVAGTGTVLTAPATTGTIITSGDTGTVTNTMLAGSIANAKLVSSTISGVALGSNLFALTIGTGLSGASYNGSAAVTVAIDSTVATLTGAQTLTNKTISAGVLTGTLTAGGGVGTSGQVLQSTGTGVTWAAGGSVMTVISKTAAYTVATTDGTNVLVKSDATGGAFSVTLYTAVGNTGNRVTIKKTDSSVNTVTIATTSAQTIDGATTKVINSQYTSFTVVSDGANWNII